MAKRKVEYRMWAEPNIKKFNDGVNWALDHGWELWGSSMITHTSHGEYDIMYCQALVRHEEVKENANPELPMWDRT